LNKEWSDAKSRIAKAAFVKKQNSKLKLERVVKFSWCVRDYHLGCILLDRLEKPEQPFVCENCLSASDSGLGRSSWVLRVFQYKAIYLPICDSSTWIQSNVNTCLKENGTDKKRIVRQVCNRRCTIETSPGMKFVYGKFPVKFQF
jgi:hypothetical protein